MALIISLNDLFDKSNNGRIRSLENSEENPDASPLRPRQGYEPIAGLTFACIDLLSLAWTCFNDWDIIDSTKSPWLVCNSQGPKLFLPSSILVACVGIWLRQVPDFQSHQWFKIPTSLLSSVFRPYPFFSVNSPNSNGSCNFFCFPSLVSGRCSIWKRRIRIQRIHWSWRKSHHIGSLDYQAHRSS